MIKTIFLGMVFSFVSLAADEHSTSVFYELRGLQAQGISFYGSAPLNRKYLEFRNSDGSHHIIYEESSALAPLVEAASLQQAMGNLNAVCSVDLECAQKAFCTGDCKNMYYEVTNLPKEQIPADHNKCKIQSFSCEKAAPSFVAAPIASAESPPRAPASVAGVAPSQTAAVNQVTATGAMPVLPKIPGMPAMPAIPPPPPLNMEE